MSRTAKPSKAILGQIIQAAREKAEMTQDELAAKVGVKQQTVSRWESGLMEPTAQRIVQLARALNVDKAVLAVGLVDQAEAGPPTSGTSRYEAIEIRQAQMEDALAMLAESMSSIASHLGITPTRPNGKSATSRKPASRRRAPIRRVQ